MKQQHPKKLAELMPEVNAAVKKILTYRSPKKDRQCSPSEHLVPSTLAWWRDGGRVRVLKWSQRCNSKAELDRTVRGFGKSE
ncbi:MAG: hypothetical protein M2R45_03293 [Verrucomicrobia subdivision 3 bacterium]|nr:hypothetical protein [Limisphaerales bacterium]MCS1415429.1 hypothetical protein [Limisphaerales bacterium]